MYDAEGRAYMTRDVLGKLQRTTYDGLGRPVLSIQNYVAQATEPEQWLWREANQCWEDGSDPDTENHNPIDHGANNDQNIIQQTEYDPDQRPHLTRNVQGDQSLTIYDAAGRIDKQIQRYVEVTRYQQPHSLEVGKSALGRWQWCAYPLTWRQLRPKHHPAN
jgi:hypothetical protein